MGYNSKYAHGKGTEICAKAIRQEQLRLTAAGAKRMLHQGVQQWAVRREGNNCERHESTTV